MGVALTPDVAVGCSCKGRESVRVHTANAKAVFLGEVVHIEPDSEKGKAFFTSDTVIFRASESWKGVSSSDVRVVTWDDEGACGFPFLVGETYLVYAFECPDCPDGLYTHFCTRTTRKTIWWERFWLGAPEWKKATGKSKGDSRNN